MTKKVRTLSPDKSVKDTLDLMAKYDIGSIVLTEDSKVVGIVTERDIVRKVLSSGADLKKRIIEVASKPVVTADSNTKVWDAFTMMLRNKFRQLPVVDEGNLVGIVTERDLFKWVVAVVYSPRVPEDIAKLIGQST